jgi:hypothetical protein
MASVRIFHQPSGEDAAVRIARALYAQGFEISTREQEKFPSAGSMAPTLAGVARGFDVAIAVIPEGGDREGWIRRELSTQAHIYPGWLIALGSHLPKSGQEADRAFHFHEDPARWVAACLLRQGKDPRRPSPSPRRPLPGPMKPFDPTMLVRAAVENGKPVELQAALAVLREATEVDGTVVFCDPLDLESTSAAWQFREMGLMAGPQGRTLRQRPSIIDPQGRIILLGVLLDGRIATAEIVELAIRKQDGFMIVGGLAASVDTSPRMLDSSDRPVVREPPESLDLVADIDPVESIESLDPDDLVEDEPDPERAMLGLIRAGGDKASWYWIGQRASGVMSPAIDCQALLGGLRERGLVTQTPTGGGMDRWRLTATGAAVLDGTLPAGPLAPPALLALIAALRKGIVTASPLLMGLARSSPEKVLGALRQVSATEPDVAGNTALSAMCLPPDRRMWYLGELLADPRAPVRAGVFDAFSQPQAEVEGDCLLPVPAADMDVLLRQGLLDPDTSVRIVAAKLAFAAARGAAMTGELMVNAAAPEHVLRHWVLLALGSARDPLTLGLLREAAAGELPGYAQCALRALAARPDGRDVWLAALGDPRPHMVEAVVFGLRRVVVGLPRGVVDWLAADRRPEVQAALASYRARNAG